MKIKEIDNLVDFNTLSRMGLIFKINKEILHPLGLAISYDKDVGDSEGAIIAEDGKWEFSAKSEAIGYERLEILNEQIKTKTIQEVVKFYKELK
ncbi:MAG: hypothetical protein [Caudoviricetes sp.]|nr:MAG: hypothetical protein [Caudoviricetes sp.]